MLPTPTPPPEHPGRDPDNQIDPTTPTGLYHVVVKKKYGKRHGDRPLWWVFLYHLIKGVTAALPYVLTAWVLKSCGLDSHGIQGGGR